MMEETNSTNAQGKMIDNFKHSLDAAEAMLREAANSTGERAADLRERAMASINATRDAMKDVQQAALVHGRKAVHATDDYVHDKPWHAVGIAAAVGLVLGLLISRR